MPAFTVAVIVTTDPLAGLGGVTESVVVVVVCALATAYDIMTSKATPKEVRGLLLRVAWPRAIALLELPNILFALPEICGSRDASMDDVVRKQDRERAYLAATMGNSHVRCVVSMQEAGWQKRNEDAALRENFTNSRISKPFN